MEMEKTISSDMAKPKRGRPPKCTTSPIGEHGSEANAAKAGLREIEKTVSAQVSDKSRIIGKIGFYPSRRLLVNQVSSVRSSRLVNHRGAVVVSERNRDIDIPSD
jgi:hypothetical protein